jgi:hypothetical protein
MTSAVVGTKATATTLEVSETATRQPVFSNTGFADEIRQYIR